MARNKLQVDVDLANEFADNNMNDFDYNEDDTTTNIKLPDDFNNVINKRHAKNIIKGLRSKIAHETAKNVNKLITLNDFNTIVKNKVPEDSDSDDGHGPIFQELDLPLFDAAIKSLEEMDPSSDEDENEREEESKIRLLKRQAEMKQEIENLSKVDDKYKNSLICSSDSSDDDDNNNNNNGDEKKESDNMQEFLKEFEIGSDDSDHDNGDESKITKDVTIKTTTHHKNDAKQAFSDSEMDFYRSIIGNNNNTAAAVCKKEQQSNKGPLVEEKKNSSSSYSSPSKIKKKSIEKLDSKKDNAIIENDEAAFYRSLMKDYNQIYNKAEEKNSKSDVKTKKTKENKVFEDFSSDEESLDDNNKIHYPDFGKKEDVERSYLSDEETDDVLASFFEKKTNKSSNLMKQMKSAVAKESDKGKRSNITSSFSNNNNSSSSNSKSNSKKGDRKESKFVDFPEESECDAFFDKGPESSDSIQRNKNQRNPIKTKRIEKRELKKSTQSLNWSTKQSTSAPSSDQLKSSKIKNFKEKQIESSKFNGDMNSKPGHSRLRVRPPSKFNV